MKIFMKLFFFVRDFFADALIRNWIFIPFPDFAGKPADGIYYAAYNPIHRGRPVLVGADKRVVFEASKFIVFVVLVSFLPNCNVENV
jgi:hypothetical protein